MSIEEEKISKLLKKLPEEELPEGFSLVLHQKLEDAAKNPAEEVYSENLWSKLKEMLGGLSILKKPQYALAFAALCLVLIISPLFFRSEGSVSVTLYNNASKQLAVGEIALLRVEFRAAKDLEDIYFLVELPEGVTFVSAHEVIAESRALAFQGDIKKKSPIVIPVAVRMVETGPQKIIVKASRLGEKKIVLRGKSS